MPAPRLIRVGTVQQPLVVIDEVSGAVGRILDLADSMTPFPRVDGGYYPGLRRTFREADKAANAYVDHLLQSIAPYVAGAFDVERFSLLDVSFSMVTDDPGSLRPPQRAPHFDSTDPRYVAVLHYLNVEPGTGTAFYRQRSTGIEQVTETNADRFVDTARREAKDQAAGAGYIQGSDPHYEMIERIEAVPDRLLIYRGSLLHCGIIPPGMDRSIDPRRGRLTANIFIRLE